MRVRRLCSLASGWINPWTDGILPVKCRLMKTDYFSLDTIENKAREMKRSIAPFLRGQTTFAPPRSALLVLDMQAYFLDASSHAYVPAAGAILPNLMRLVRAYVGNGFPVVFTRHINTPGNARSMSVWWKDLITADDPLSRVALPVDISQGRLIEKSQYDAFHGTDLESFLSEKGVRQVVVGGVMTHLCCETTARSAFVRGFDVFFLIDGTATYNEQFHRATLLNLAHGFAVPVTTDEILAEVKTS